MDFIFMLTRNDRTVEDCLDLVDLIEPLGLKHVGFKDVGVAPDVLRKLAGAISRTGATTYMEVVSTTAGSLPRLGAHRPRPRHRPAARRHPGRRDHGAARGQRRPNTTLFRAGRSATRPSSAARRKMSRPIAAPSPRRAARDATSLPTAPPRPIRSSWSAPPGVGSAVGASDRRRRGRLGRSDQGDQARPAPTLSPSAQRFSTVPIRRRKVLSSRNCGTSSRIASVSWQSSASTSAPRA